MGRKEDEKVMAYIRYPSREAKRNYFPVPNCVMELKLPWKKLAVYLYLIHRYRYQYRTGFDYPRMLSESFGISKQTAKKHLDYLFDEGLIRTTGPMIFPKHYIGKYEDWPANFFPLPKEIFNLGLSMGEVVLYSYLMYREDRKSFSCLVSRSRLWEVMGMSTNTAAKYIRLLEEKRFIETEHTTCKRQNGEPLNGQLRFRILPIEGAKIRLSELQMEQNTV